MIVSDYERRILEVKLFDSMQENFKEKIYFENEQFINEKYQRLIPYYKEIERISGGVFETYTLFQCAVLISVNVEETFGIGQTFSFMIHATEVFADAICKEEIVPRQIGTYIPWNKTPNPTNAFRNISMDWVLYPEDFCNFVKSRWPARFFDDVCNEENNFVYTKESDKISTKERESLLRTIKAFCIILIEKSGSKYGTINNPNYTQLANIVKQSLLNHDSSTLGQGKTTLIGKIREAFSLD